MADSGENFHVHVHVPPAPGSVFSSLVSTCFNWLLSNVLTSALEPTLSSWMSEKKERKIILEMISKWNKSFESLFFSFYDNDAEAKNPQLNLEFPWRLSSTVHRTQKIYQIYLQIPCWLGRTTFSVIGTCCSLLWSNCSTSERSGRLDGGGILSAVRSEIKTEDIESIKIIKQSLTWNHPF